MFNITPEPEDIWGWFRQNYDVDLSMFGSEAEVRAFVNGLFDQDKAKGGNWYFTQSTQGDAVFQIALGEWQEIGVVAEEEATEEEKYHARELRRLRGERMARKGALEAVPTVTAPPIEVPEERVPEITTPGERAKEVVGEIEKGVEQSTAPTLGERIVGVGKRMAKTVSDVLQGMADRIRRLSE